MHLKKKKKKNVSITLFKATSGEISELKAMVWSPLQAASGELTLRVERHQ